MKRLFLYLVSMMVILAFFLPGCDTVSEYPEPSPEAIEAQVTYVVDGDTIEVEIHRDSETGSRVETARIRYIGIDTPEIEHVFGTWVSAEPLGREAAEKNLDLVGGETVMLEWDVSTTDRYGRYLCYVWVDDIFVNAELVTLGYARSEAYPPDIKYHSYFEKLEAEADDAGRGIWSIFPHESGQ